MSIRAATSAAIFVLSVGLSIPARDDPPAPRTFHIAPGGKDAYDGSAARPFASLHRARDAVRALRREQGGALKQMVTVLVAGGTYRLDAPFELTPEDSGTASCPVVYAAREKEHPILSGGRPVTGWKPAEANGRKLLSADLADVREGKWRFHQLWVNGERRTRARHPNAGFLEVASLPDQPPKGGRYPGGKRFRFAPGDLRRWDNLQDVDVVALHLWVSVRLAVESIDEKESIVNFVMNSRRRLVDGSKPARYFVENALELLDAPGEWYLDRKKETLYYAPAKGEKFPDAEVVAPKLPTLVRFKGEAEKGRFVEHVTLRGLTVADTEWWPARDDTCDVQAVADVPAVVHGDGMRHCALDRCTVTRASGYGVHLARGCSQNRVSHCHLHDLGAGGVKVGETAIRENRQEQTHANAVTDNHIHDVGKVFLQAVGVWVGQSYDNTIAHNHIHDLTYTGISAGWTWGYGKTLARGNIIEKNRVHHVGQGLLSDMGGVYTLGVQPGTIIRHNVFQDIDAYQYGGWGIYFDEGSTGIVAEGNLVYRTKHGGFHQHYGKDNVVRNNVFAFGKHAQVRRTRVEPHRSFTFERNVVCWKEGKLLDGNWDGDGYRFEKNLYGFADKGEVMFSKWTLAQWREGGQDRESVLADPLFVDAEKGNFRSLEGSPISKIGFAALKVADAGPR